jgi:hypothetical protein
MKLDTLEPPFTSLTSTSVASRPIRCTLIIPVLLVSRFLCLARAHLRGARGLAYCLRARTTALG